ncbi:multiubiquitin domain-containing protein [Ralstonia pseudosolanacearum]
MSTEHEHHEEVIDLEAYGKGKKPVPPGRKYKIKIDKHEYVVSVSEMTGRDILALAGKTPDKFILQQKIGPAVHRVEPDQIVSFLAHGVERFMTIPREVTEGEGPQGRRDFDLLPQDEHYLVSRGLLWEAVLESGVRRIVIHDLPIPQGYNVASASVYVRIEAGYPDTQIDMAYFYPHLRRSDQRPINALAAENFDGKEWQRWSRHRTGASAWRIGEDNLGTHLELVADWLCSELLK